MLHCKDTTSKTRCQEFRNIFLQIFIRLGFFVGIQRQLPSSVKVVCGNDASCKVAGCKLRVAKLRFQKLRLHVIQAQPATRNFRWVSSCVYVCMYTYLINKNKIKKKNIPIGLRLRVRTDTEKYSKIQRRVAGCRLRFDYVLKG